MVGSSPARDQLAGNPSVGLFKSVPSSNVELLHKFPGRISGSGGDVFTIEKSSMIIVPVVSPEPPLTSETRKIAAPSGTTTLSLRFTKGEFVTLPAQPALRLCAVKCLTSIAPPLALRN